MRYYRKKFFLFGIFCNYDTVRTREHWNEDHGSMFSPMCRSRFCILQTKKNKNKIEIKKSIIFCFFLLTFPQCSLARNKHDHDHLG